MADQDLSAEALAREAKVDLDRWRKLPSSAEVEATAKAIAERGINVKVVQSAAEALAAVKAAIPAGAEVMTGSSTTLIEIGLVAHLKEGKHGWKNLMEAIQAEKDEKKKSEMRRMAVTAEYFLASVNAIAKTGEVVACDRSGSRVGAFPFAAKNLLLVSGVNKIVPTLQDTLQRLNDFVYPLENVRAQKAYGVNSAVAKIVILARETLPNRTSLILVNERLGY